ncbi:D-alanine--D-alanine ligase B [Acidipropionibacterium acidipropionici ATCC 4875]|jgi:D-alanine-D-alanine ligase|uniref:D-alanine--D-alanine ligase n=3 Tax=Acidipropionibacterium acidipropionici TaxID=1748 RepID=K7S9E3_ACIA4|nr:D-alanine--D-alanine ligase B [Acidipropionibacterium acidipropionici ATCC 4875]
MGDMKHPVVVLAGGLSHQRDVSLRSGHNVATALRRAGHEVTEADVDSNLVATLLGIDGVVAFPMLHGGVGEDGSLREVLNLLQIPYVGSGPGTSRMAYDKSIGSRMAAAAGVRTPRQVALPHDVFRELGASALVAALADHVGLPLIVKPARGGSSLGVSRVDDVAGLPQAMATAYAYDDLVVVEQFIEGTELAIGMITTRQGTEVLPAVEIRPVGGVYDYAAMYTAGETRLTAPADISPAAASEAEEIARTAAQVLDLSGISRVDAIVGKDGHPVFLEAGVAPGMTDTSLVPVGMQAAGLDLAEVCSRLVSDAAGDDLDGDDD